MPSRTPGLSFRKLAVVLGIAVLVSTVMVLRGSLSDHASCCRLPSKASLAGMDMSQRIVAIADSQVGYRTKPSNSYCNKFSAFWHAGTGNCPRGEENEEWCADFAAWAWQRAGVQVTYGYSAGEIDGAAVSFYDWAAATGHWHPATRGFVADPGDVAVYGLALGADPTAAHVAIVTGDSAGQRGPDVVNGDGDKTGFSVVEAATDQARVETGHDSFTLSGYVSPP